MPTLAESVESYAKNAKAMLAAQDFAGAAREGSHALEILPVLSQVATMRGHGLLTPLINRAMDDSNTYRFSRNDFKEPYEAFRLAMIMDPGNAEAAKELEQLSALLERLGGNEVDEAGAS
jgi:nucleotide-binding universal stress UspA family protein